MFQSLLNTGKHAGAACACPFLSYSTLSLSARRIPPPLHFRACVHRAIPGYSIHTQYSVLHAPYLWLITAQSILRTGYVPSTPTAVFLAEDSWLVSRQPRPKEPLVTRASYLYGVPFIQNPYTYLVGILQRANNIHIHTLLCIEPSTALSH